MKIVHVIGSLHVGGAEILLKNTINLFPEYEHYIIYLEKPDDLLKQINVINEAVCLHHSSRRQLFSTVKKLRQLLAKWKPDIIHAHLYESTLITRFATPSHIPLISTIHSTYSIDAFQKSRKALWAERLTVHKQKAIIAVSKFVLDDYLAHVPFKGKSYVLHNFLPASNLPGSSKRNQPDGMFRCIAVGNLKEAKNYSYLIEVFSYLKEEPITLDIYGDGPLRSCLQQQIEETSAHVQLCGPTSKVQEKMRQYDLFIQASTHEGYGISVAEAMAIKVPAFLSDIPVFKEVTDGNALFFPLTDARVAAERLKQLIANDSPLAEVAESACHYIHSTASESLYKQKLEEIYLSLVPSNNLELVNPNLPSFYQDSAKD